MEGLIFFGVLLILLSDMDETVRNSHFDEWMYAPEDYPKGKSSSIRR